MSDYDAGWNAWLDGNDCPPEDASEQWIKGFQEAAGEYPRDDQ